jgi:hypothetical protein
LTADLDAKSSRGDIVLWLPDFGRYAVDAKSTFGTVSSDFAGSTRVLLSRVGESFSANEASPAAHLRLRMGFGGVAIKRLPPQVEPRVTSLSGDLRPPATEHLE